MKWKKKTSKKQKLAVQKVQNWWIKYKHLNTVIAISFSLLFLSHQSYERAADGKYGYLMHSKSIQRGRHNSVLTKQILVC